MTAEELDSLRELLAQFPEVTWDRLVDAPGWIRVYGWVPHEHREDRMDFVLIDRYADNGGDGTHTVMITSNPVRSAEWGERLHGPEGAHIDCQRVSEVLG